MFISITFTETSIDETNKTQLKVRGSKFMFKLCPPTFTRYGSNITNVWQEFFTPMTLAFSCEVVHEKSVNICKSYSKKISGTFFSGHDVYICILFVLLVIVFYIICMSFSIWLSGRKDASKLMMMLTMMMMIITELLCCVVACDSFWNSEAWTVVGDSWSKVILLTT